jgi:hypothetical protein
LFGDETSGTISIGRNEAIEVISVQTLTNTLTVTASTILFDSNQFSDLLPPLLAFRKNVWRNDQIFTPSKAVAFGRFGHSVSMWGSGECVVGAPNGESDVACCGSTTNVQIRGGTAHALTLSRHESIADYDGSNVEQGTVSNVTDSLTVILASTALNYDDAYIHHTVVIGSDTRLITQYLGKSRAAQVDYPPLQTTTIS